MVDELNVMIVNAKSVLTRTLHLALLIAVMHQLVGSSIMEAPRLGQPGGLIFDLHEWGGLTSLGLVLLFWFWTLIRRGEATLPALLPWFSSIRRALVWADFKLHVRSLARLRLPEEGDGALASAVHGLGLLTVTAMAVTGTASLIAPGLAEQLIGVHKVIANFMWAYLIAHASIAIIHQLGGRDVMRQMFFWTSRERPREMDLFR